MDLHSELKFSVSLLLGGAGGDEDDEEDEEAADQEPDPPLLVPQIVVHAQALGTVEGAAVGVVEAAISVVDAHPRFCNGRQRA
eukprot:CAMPEP_0202963978 /NCGR_PEP_ID=MMETSP1396-20130829/8042_1 /ASSEMBLY_ACC=CAM_ASM_000872 /TAXON_ID= /ORGANISM="Pseudokeronopsis sp., Strain Brazil" /LENGTH=82 /DNA_ID=CAMNT_0049685689 /DNA_START=210 /DNA_END=458 /DNA_ORIENTATION=+